MTTLQQGEPWESRFEKFLRYRGIERRRRTDLDINGGERQENHTNHINHTEDTNHTDDANHTDDTNQSNHTDHTIQYYDASYTHDSPDIHEDAEDHEDPDLPIDPEVNLFFRNHILRDLLHQVLHDQLFPRNEPSNEASEEHSEQPSEEPSGEPTREPPQENTALHHILRARAILEAIGYSDSEWDEDWSSDGSSNQHVGPLAGFSRLGLQMLRAQDESLESSVEWDARADRVVDGNLDEDAYYVDRRGSFGEPAGNLAPDDEPEEAEDPDFLFEYVAINKHGDRRFSNNTQRPDERDEKDGKNGKEIGELNDLRAVAPLDGFSHWEVHDTTTLREIDGNFGLYDAYHPHFTVCDSADPMVLTRRPMAAMFRDSVQMRPVGTARLTGLRGVRRYKNNLAVVINDMLICGCNSEVLVYRFDALTLLPKSPALRFDTRPAFTTSNDRVTSTWPMFPHTLNYMTTGEFAGQKVLGACSDDGTLMVWFAETIEKVAKEEHGKYNRKKRIGGDDSNGGDFGRYEDGDGAFEELGGFEEFGGFQEFGGAQEFGGFGSPRNDGFSDSISSVPANFKLRVESSVWGMDFLTYDHEGMRHNVIAVSDNSQSLTVFYYHEGDARFYHVRLCQILHNIPDVSIVSHTVNCGVHTLRISCASISGELVVFEVRFRVVSGPVEHHTSATVYYADELFVAPENAEVHDVPSSTRFGRVLFSAPRVVARTLLDSDCWTTKPVSSRDFVPVQSLRAVFGDPSIDEHAETAHIKTESRILGAVPDSVHSSHLGLAAGWQFFECVAAAFLPPSGAVGAVLSSAKQTSVDSEYRRISKGLRRWREIGEEKGKGIGEMGRGRGGKEKEESGGEKVHGYDNRCGFDSQDFLVVTTSKKVALFRADTLFCASATQTLFDVLMPRSEESKFTNRMSISHIIPELSCAIVVSQEGLCSVMRLTQHRGVYGMRQEYVFPNAPCMALGRSGFRSIAGVAVRDRTPPGAAPRFMVYIVYTDGIVLGYELSVAEDLEVVRI